MSKVVNMPATTEFKLGGLTLQLKLDGRAILKVEQRLGEGIQGLFIKNQGEFKIPPINQMLIVLQGANKISGVTEQNVADAYFDFIDNQDGDNMQIFTLITTLAEESGLFGSKKDVTPTDGELGEENLSLEPTVTEEPVL